MDRGGENVAPVKTYSIVDAKTGQHISEVSLADKDFDEFNDLVAEQGYYLTEGE